MASSLLRTKLYIPRMRPQLVPRPRLVARLNDGMRSGRKLTLICAPAGFGKSTLLSEWVHSGVQSSEVCWLSLDRGDNDPTRFIAYLIGSVRTVEPTFGEGTLAALQSPRPMPPTSPVQRDTSSDATGGAAAGGQEASSRIGRSMASLVNQLGEVPLHLVLVLDDYQAIHARPVHEAVAFLLEYLPDNVHLVIATRADPPLPVARLRAHGELTEVRQADLRFTHEEATAFLNRAMSLDLSVDDIAALAARTEGWIAGLQMAAVSMQGSRDAAEFVRALTGSHRFILDYLTEEVLDQQSESVQRFLLETSILERLCGPLCDAVCESLGPRDGQAALEALEASNLFISALDDDRRWYRYHQLFGDLLQKRLQRAYPDRVPLLHGRASAWYEEQGLIPAAIDHALASGDVDWAAELIERAAESHMLRSELSTLQGWIETLPDDIVNARPLLSIDYAFTSVLNGHPLEEAEERVQRAIEADTENALRGEVQAFRALIASYRGDTRQSAALCEDALSLLPADRLFYRSFVSAFLGLVYLYIGDIAAATPIFAQAARIGKQAGNLTVTMLALCHLAELALMQARLGTAKAHYEEALSLAVDEHQQRRPIAGLALIGLGQLFREMNDLERAEQVLDEGIALAADWARAGAIGGYVNLARVKQARGDEQGAREAIQSAEQLASEFDAMQLDDVYVSIARARLLLALGDTRPVEQWVRERGLADDAELMTVTGETGPLSTPFLRAVEYTVLAELHIAQGHHLEALQLIERLIEIARAADWDALTIKLRGMESLCRHALGDQEGAMRALEWALVHGEPAGYVRMFIDEGPALGTLLEQAKERETAAGYATRLLAALDRGAAPSTQAAVPAPASRRLSPQETLVEALSEREMQVLRMLTTHLSSTEIAEELFVSVNTARTHIKNIYGKLDVHGRAEAIARAEELGLL